MTCAPAVRAKSSSIATAVSDQAMIRRLITACLLFCAGSAWAEDVTLTSLDGAVEITGELLGFDGEFYRVGTDFGELTVDAGGVRCDGPGCPNLTEFVPTVQLVGAAPLGDLLIPSLIESFARQSRMQVSLTVMESGVRYTLLRPASGDAALHFDIRSGTTRDGIVALIDGEADLALALREIRPEERAAARRAGLGDLQETGLSLVLALDAMVAAVAPGNPVRAISPRDLGRAFSGVITNWEELGGENAPITLHLPPDGSGLSEVIADRFLSPEGLTVTEGRRHANTRALSSALASDPFGLGLVSKSEIGSARALKLSSGCGHGLAASAQSVKTEDYPLTAPLFVYQPMRRLPKLGRDFVAYVQGADAQLVIRAAGFTDQELDQIGLAGQGERLANAVLAAGPEVSLEEVQEMVALMRDTDRLSLTVRFERGSPNPDAQSRGNIQRLARALERGRFDGQRLIFVGFSDGEGGAAANQRIAKRRADAVRDAVLSMAETADTSQVQIETIGFGEALPMACDDSDWGRRINRRVEIWLR